MICVCVLSEGNDALHATIFHAFAFSLEKKISPTEKKANNLFLKSVLKSYLVKSKDYVAQNKYIFEKINKPRIMYFNYPKNIIS